MTPQNKCVSLETARRLKEEGFPQDTERRWIRTEHTWFIDPMMATPDALIKHGVWYSAPDAQETGELLPYTLESDGIFYYLQVNKDYYENSKKEVWRWTYADIDGENLLDSDGESENMAECLADGWLYLKENNLL